MTPLNTIIEEILNEWCNKYGHFLAFESDALTELTTAMQRAYEAGRASWLRSEIEKLEGMQSLSRSQYLGTRTPETWGELEVLEILITRYKEELLELEKGV